MASEAAIAVAREAQRHGAIGRSAKIIRVAVPGFGARRPEVGGLPTAIDITSRCRVHPAWNSSPLRRTGQVDTAQSPPQRWLPPKPPNTATAGRVGPW